MKIIIKNLSLAILLIMSEPKLLAQSIYSFGVNPDNITCLQEGYQNSSVIDYTPSASSSGGNYKLKAIVSDNLGILATPNTTLTIDDGVNTPVCITISGSQADVAIGNYTTSGLYTIAVVYAAYSSTPCPGDGVFMDKYTVTNPGTVGFTAVYAGTYTIVPSGHGLGSWYPHIDVIADYTNMTAPGGYPICDNVAIGWTDWNTTICGGLTNPYYGVNVSFENLTIPTNFPSIANQYTAYSPYVCDIAGVFNSAGYSAYLTYTDVANNLFEEDVTFPGGVATLGAVTSLGSGGYANFPTIDAIDNYYYNDFTNPLNPNIIWMVGTMTNAVVPDVDVFYLQNGTISSTNLSTWSGSYLDDEYPRVTCGQGKVYSIAFAHFDPSLEVVSTSFPWAGPVTAPSTYYALNTSSLAPILYNPDAYSLSSTCNNDASFVAAGAPVLLGTYSNIGAVYQMDVPDVHNWKYANFTTVNKVNAKDFEVTPNPANDFIKITAPDNSVTLRYTIEDLNGKKIIEGDTQNEEHIDVRNLASGVYLISVSGANKIACKMKITKL